MMLCRKFLALDQSCKILNGKMCWGSNDSPKHTMANQDIYIYIVLIITIRNHVQYVEMDRLVPIRWAACFASGSPSAIANEKEKKN